MAGGGTFKEMFCGSVVVFLRDRRQDVPDFHSPGNTLTGYVLKLSDSLMHQHPGYFSPTR